MEGDETEEESYLDQHPSALVPNLGHYNLRLPVVEEAGLVRFRLREHHRYHHPQLNLKQYSG